jgi:hypothetical protein
MVARGNLFRKGWIRRVEGEKVFQLRKSNRVFFHFKSKEFVFIIVCITYQLTVMIWFGTDIINLKRCILSNI